MAEDDRMQRERLRRSLRAQRAALPEAQVRAASASVAAEVAPLPAFRRAARVALYAAMRGEIDPAGLRTLCDARGTEVAFPRVVTTDPPLLGFALAAAGEPLIPGAFGIFEPREGHLIEATTLDVILVPGVAFARDGHRLGFGRGYYDRVLGAAPGAVRVGLCHAFQLVDRFPPRAGDEPVDFIVTPRELLTTGARLLAPEEVPS